MYQVFYPQSVIDEHEVFLRELLGPDVVFVSYSDCAKARARADELMQERLRRLERLCSR